MKNKTKTRAILIGFILLIGWICSVLSPNETNDVQKSITPRATTKIVQFSTETPKSISIRRYTPTPTGTPKPTSTPSSEYYVSSESMTVVYDIPSIITSNKSLIKPNVKYEIIGRNKDNTWYQILLKDDENVPMWVYAREVSSNVDDTNIQNIPITTSAEDEGPSTTIAKNENMVTANNGNVNLRQGPGTNYNIASTLSQGDSLKIVGQYEDWYQVETLEGNTAWVANFVVETNIVDTDIPTISDIPPTPVLPTDTPVPQILPTNTTVVYNTPVPAQHPAGATAICNDGTYSESKNRKGTCSRHGGVRQWLP